MAGNLIEVGAVFDGAQLKTAVAEATANIQQSLAKMQLAFDELKATTTARINELEAKLREIPVATSEMADRVEVDAERARESIHAMGLSMEATGININRHMRTVLNEIPLLQEGFKLMFPVFAGIAAIEILTKVGEKISELISDTFIFTEAMKEEQKALIASNSELEKNAQRLKELGRETQIAAEKTQEGKEKLKLAFRFEDLGGDPAQLKAKLDPLLAEFSKLQAVFAQSNKFAVPDALKELGFGQEIPGQRVKAAQERIAELSVEINRLSSALKVAGAESTKTGQDIKNHLDDEADKAAKKQQALADQVERAFQHVIHSRHNLTEEMIKEAHRQAAAETESGLALDAIERTRVAEAEKNVKAAEISADADVKHAEAMMTMKQKELAFELQIGKMGQSEHDRLLDAELQKEYQAGMASLQFKLRLAQGDIAETAKVNAQILALNDRHNAQMQASDQKSFLQRKQKFDQYFQQISGSFNSAINGWIQGTQTAAQAFGQMFTNILGNLVSFVERWIEHKVEMWLMDELLGKTANISQVETHNLSNALMAESDSYLAAANAYAAYAAFPPVAAAMAATAKTAVSGFAIAAAKFELGGIVPATGMAMVHEGEKILPASMSGTGAGIGGGDIHVHFNMGAVDGETGATFIKRQSKSIVDLLHREWKKKGIK